MHFIITFFVFLFVAALFELLKNPNKWYGDMLCLDCGYRWRSRKSQPPARCPKCSGRHLHTATKNQPVPAKPAFSIQGTPSIIEARRGHIAPLLPEKIVTRSSPKVAAAHAQAEHFVDYSLDKEKEKHKQLEKILALTDISIEEKAYFLIAYTRNADPTNLMHRLKVDEEKANELLDYLERFGHVSPKDDLGERLVTAQERP